MTQHVWAQMYQICTEFLESNTLKDLMDRAENAQHSSTIALTAVRRRFGRDGMHHRRLVPRQQRVRPTRAAWAMPR